MCRPRGRFPSVRVLALAASAAVLGLPTPVGAEPPGPGALTAAEGTLLVEALGVAGIAPAKASPKVAADTMKVTFCPAPGPNPCATEPFDVTRTLEIRLLPAYVGSVRVELKRGPATAWSMECGSNVVSSQCRGAPAGNLPSGRYRIEGYAKPGTAGGYSLLVSYA